nr:cytochrome c oxidase assembly protein [uncultured Actinoplanes sp.]
MTQLIVSLLLAAGLGYATALLAVRRQARDWPLRRTVFWFAGLAAAAVAVTGPPPGAAGHPMGGHHDLTAHMLTHLLLGMAAPLLLVVAAPLTLALRALPTPYARRLSGLLGSAPVRAVTHPVTALILNAGGMWLLYTTGLYQVPGHQLHLLGAGYLFTAAVVGVDPASHRPGRRTRAVVLLVYLAAHSILAKYLYGHPPAGVRPADGRSAAELMYYGGDLIDIALIAEFCRQWYAAGRPGHRRREHRAWRLPDDIRLGDAPSGAAVPTGTGWRTSGTAATPHCAAHRPGR